MDQVSENCPQVSHFLNALKCQKHLHGVQCASCSIDSLAEVYYFGVFLYDKCKSSDNKLLQILINVCEIRTRTGPSCGVRENLWNWLSGNIDGFRPKGRPDAEILQAFECFQDPRFLQHYDGHGICPVCCETFPVSATGKPVHYYLQEVNSKYPGKFSAGMQWMLDRELYRQCGKYSCNVCNSILYTELENENRHMPDFLLVTPGLDKNGRNSQTPYLEIEETMVVHGVVYYLKAAVMVKPGHFYAIVKHNNMFLVIDDLSYRQEKYSNFSNALKRRDDRCVENSSITVLTPIHDGVHLLLFSKNCHVVENQLSTVNPHCKGPSWKEDTTNSFSDSFSAVPLAASTPIKSVSVVRKNKCKRRQKAAVDNVFPDEKQINPQPNCEIVMEKLTKTLDEAGFVHICGKAVPYAIFGNEVFIANDVLQLSGFNVQRGYSYVDALLKAKTLMKKPTFLVQGKKRSWISREALLALLTDETLYGQTKKRLVEECVRTMQVTPLKTTVCPDTNSEATTADGLTLCGFKVSHKLMNGNLFLDLANILRFTEIFAHISKNGWGLIDECLLKHGVNLEEAFDTTRKKQQRFYISVKALKIVLTHSRAGNRNKKLQLREGLFDLVHTVASCGHVTHQHVTLKDYVNHQFDGKKEFLNTLAESLVKPGGKEVSGGFSGALHTDDIGYVVETAYRKCGDHGIKTKGKIKQQVQKMYSALHPIEPEEVVDIIDNFSGTNLMHEMRRKLPGVLPSAAKERKAKNTYKRSFQSVLLPRRTSTGWEIDASRLLDMLSFRYSFLTGHLKVRIWGDGREIGGRHSTFLALSLVNHEMFLRGISYQNPNETYPISIFYESDSRDNLEMNLGFNSNVERMMQRYPQNEYYLCGDEMFLIKVLDGSKQLSPTSDTGWNFYHYAKKEVIKECAPNGVHTDLPVLVDREHIESLLPSVQLTHTVFDIMHGLTRIVEKLLNLEVEKILSEGHKSQQGSGMPSKALLNNLVANINRRGIRQGNFQIYLDKSGKPEPISLNKDHALGIISPPPVGHEREFPHVLENVVPKRNITPVLSSEARNLIGLPEVCTEFDLAAKIWSSLHQMFTILKQEPSPVILPGTPSGSLHVNDYHWGYSSVQKDEYKKAAECFYQLMCSRFTWKNITPYMVKFIDYARYFMSEQDVPMCRFQAEGGEHLNYQHSRHYYQHTTRHGGKDKADPQLTLLSTMFRRLCFQITSADANVASVFKQLVNRHSAACLIQANYRGYLTRKLLSEKGYRANGATFLINQAIMCEAQESLYPHLGQLPQANVLSGLAFVFVGSVPSQAKKRWTQSALEKEVKLLGGTVYKGLPGCTKGRSTKKYYLLVNSGTLSKKVPDIIREAISRRYTVLDYSFVFECIERNCLVDQGMYLPDISGLLKTISVEPTLAEQHFKRKPRMISLIKKIVKKSSTRINSNDKVERNAAVFYGNMKRRAAIENEEQSFIKQARLFGQHCKAYSSLPSDEQSQYKDMWYQKKNAVAQRKDQENLLKSYNIVSHPLYADVSANLTVAPNGCFEGLT